ncbi:VanZ family protein [Variovorax ginsengisoli]|uniref:VanZ family protein n=2 Tax=Variovorax guangxiensis TaxID=1775474 RepID=A0A502DM01_9BURK|nr:VanZ family protein [Variovorax ginsengisoli]TPG26084.1 VanZ family protein [Variovorax guangxiensis]
MLTLMVLSLMPPSPSLPSTGWDKSNHMLGFAVLAILGHFAWPGRRWSMLLGLLAYGGLIEVLQSFTPDRFAELGDLVADGAGLLAGKALATLYKRLASTRF